MAPQKAPIPPPDQRGDGGHCRTAVLASVAIAAYETASAPSARMASEPAT